MERFSNNGASTLNGAINNSTTSVVVTSASSFPTAGNFRIRVDDEIMLVTAISGTTLTATRGAEGTTAASHSDGAIVRHVLTAGALVAAHTFVGVHVNRSTSKAITANTDTLVDFDAERYDTANFHDNSTNNSRLTVPTGFAGRYLIVFNCDWQDVGTGVREARIRLNGSTYLGLNTTNAVSGQGFRVSVSAIANLSAGDYVEALVRSASSINLQANDRYGIELMMGLLGL